MLHVPVPTSSTDQKTLSRLRTNAVHAGLEASAIDILVTNCSIYCPVPSMATTLVNAFGMRDDVEAYHLGGMGCSMGVVGLNLVRDLLVVSLGIKRCGVSELGWVRAMAHGSVSRLAAGDLPGACY